MAWQFLCINCPNELFRKETKKKEIAVGDGKEIGMELIKVTLALIISYFKSKLGPWLQMNHAYVWFFHEFEHWFSCACKSLLFFLKA